jgi:uncharacterized protein YcbX
MFVSRILVHPIKSLDGVEVASARVTPGGSLEHDRAYAILDAEGKFVNGKRHARVHALRSVFSDDLAEVTFESAGESARRTFALAEPTACEQWLGDFFGFAVTLAANRESGFPDDDSAPGPTVVSEASLEEVTRWFPGMSVSEVRKRFRSNIELSGTEVFGEDRLFGPPGEMKPFHLGEVQVLGSNPCQRCAVPTRDPESGEVTPGFQKQFSEKRAASLPPWANATRFNHFYRFAVNTRIPASETGKWIRTGDPLRLE